jgi:hypothetical protein
MLCYDEKISIQCGCVKGQTQHIVVLYKNTSFRPHISGDGAGTLKINGQVALKMLMLTA